jgi:hypothetical protein
MVIFLTVFCTARIGISGLIWQDCQWADQIPIKNKQRVRLRSFSSPFTIFYPSNLKKHLDVHFNEGETGVCRPRPHC